jgi:hypothetical protein
MQVTRITHIRKIISLKEARAVAGNYTQSNILMSTLSEVGREEE